jgi:hypothetical protein
MTYLVFIFIYGNSSIQQVQRVPIMHIQVHGLLLIVIFRYTSIEIPEVSCLVMSTATTT